MEEARASIEDAADVFELMKVDSMIRAATKPRAQPSLWRFRRGYGTTALPTLAMIRSSSRNAARKMRLSWPPPET
jgi:hypothetical protein